MASVFKICRKGRSTSNLGGALLIATKYSLPAEEIPLMDFPHLDVCCVRLSINSTSFIYIICSYIPPCSLLDIYPNHFSIFNSFFAKLKPSGKLLIVGDFNLPLVNWDIDVVTGHLFPILSDSPSSIFLNNISSLGLYQISPFKNHLVRTLDLCFIDDPQSNSIQRSPPLSYSEDKYHSTFEIYINYPIDSFRYKRYRYPSLYICISH